MSGFSPIITTASTHNEARLKSLGATHVLDRKAVSISSLAQAVKAITPEPIKVAFDAVSLQETQNAAYDVLSPGGKLVILRPLAVDEARRAQDKTIVSVYGNVHRADQRDVGVGLYAHLTDYLTSGEIKVRHGILVPRFG